MIESSKNWL